MREPVNDFIAEFENADQGEDEEESVCTVLPLTYTADSRLFDEQPAALAAAKETILVLSEARSFTIFSNKKIKLSLLITKDGIGLYIQSAKKQKSLHFKITAEKEEVLLEKHVDASLPGDIIVLQNPLKFINRTLRISLDTGLYKKEIKIKFLHKGVKGYVE
jgi:hypothetical protein